jgi:1,4-alpha-glucan branching enzyme
MGIAVIIDLVHSHAVKNIAEGLNQFDGSDDQYFHPGGRGNHDLWDSKLFNYHKEEVLQFLLSNVKYWISEFNVDGYRYDGVTSMLYFHHGDISFDHYDRYFNEVDWDVLTYFQLANTLIKELNPHAIVIAEDMSGMPGLCRPVEEGGLGFDFRLGMGIPDFWIKTLKHKTDEQWNIHELWGTLTNRRYGERTISYAESHDQALVGDKSIAFWLMDKEMYTHMHKDYESPIIDRGIALHKMIRLLTMALGGEGWLNFIGNEFGHPEWVDFPREGNGWSYKYARRQWNLQVHPDLRYQFLYKFGADMVNLARKEKLMSALPAQQLNMDENNHTIIFERDNLIFAFNFHPTHSIPDYRFRVPAAGKYKIMLNSDSAEYGGFNRIDDKMNYPTVTLFGEHFLSVYLPNRVVLVLKKVK